MTTSTTYVGDGATRTYNIAFPFDDPATVFVTVDDAAATYVWTGASQIQLQSAPAAGAVVRIYRKTPISSPDVVFTDAQVLTDDALNDAVKQLLYSQQELEGDVSGVAGSALRVPQGELLDRLPVASARALKYLTFNALGQPALASSALQVAPYSPEGAVARSIQSKLGDLVSVKDYGAVGDGEAIDVAAINKAIRACTAGQTLYFPAGVYLIDGSDIQTYGGGQVHTVPLPIGVNVLMDGGAWLKRAPADTGGPIFLTALGRNRIQANIDGDEFPLAGGMTGAWRTDGGIGVYGFGAADVDVSGCHFRNLTFGVEAHAPTRWKVCANDFYRIKQSGGIFYATSGGPVSRVLIQGNTVEDMGDTAFAAISVAPGYVVTGVEMSGNVVFNTQYRTQGFALDIEGGHGWDLQRNNRICGNIVIQAVPSVHGQGGVTMNLFCQDGLVSDNLLISGSFAAGDVGVSIRGTRRVSAFGNRIVGFAGGGIYADGADRPSICGNDIHNCGNLANPETSTVLLALTRGTIQPIVKGNRISFSPGYAGGVGGAAIFGRHYVPLDDPANPTFPTDAIVRDNVIDAPPGRAIALVGTDDTKRVGKVFVEGNLIVSPATAATVQIGWNTGGRVQGNRQSGGNQVPVFTNAHSSTIIKDNDGHIDVLVNAVDDTAAAAAGVLLGQDYRNGSVRMTRIT